jgi:hypothetical protein
MATRRYVAIEMSFDARTDKVTCMANKDMVITGVNGATVSIRKGEKFNEIIPRAVSHLPHKPVISLSLTR